MRWIFLRLLRKNKIYSTLRYSVSTIYYRQRRHTEHQNRVERLDVIALYRRRRRRECTILCTIDLVELLYRRSNGKTTAPAKQNDRLYFVFIFNGESCDTHLIASNICSDCTTITHISLVPPVKVAIKRGIHNLHPLHTCASNNVSRCVILKSNTNRTDGTMQQRLHMIPTNYFSEQCMSNWLVCL